MEDFRFKVNLGGMIEILSDHLYSSPDVYIRELLQNGADAITGRRKLQGAEVEGEITLEITEGKQLIFTDNGQGLTEEEIHQFLAIIGESSKRELKHKDWPKYRKQGKIEALKAAREKASYLVEAMGKQLGEVIRIVEPADNNISRYIPFQAQSNVSMGTAATEQYRVIKLRYEMTARFAIK